MVLSKEDFEKLKKHEDVLKRFDLNSWSSPRIELETRQELASHYNQIANGGHTDFDNDWIKRLSHWYFEAKAEYERPIEEASV